MLAGLDTNVFKRYSRANHPFRHACLAFRYARMAGGSAGGTSTMKRTLCLRSALVSSLQLVSFLVVFASMAFGQGGNGSITGTITDSGGAVVAAVAVEAKNTETGVVRTAVSTG